MTTPTRTETVPTVSLRFDGAEIPARTFLDAADTLLALLREVGRSVPGETRIAWQVADFRGGSALATFRAPVGAAQSAAATIAGTVSGLREIEHSGSRPRHFSGAALARATELATLMTRPESGSRVFSEGVDLANPSVEITSRSVATLEKLGPARWRSTGSVRGILEMMTIHGASKIAVYDPDTGERTDCHCAPAMIREATTLFGQRVVVGGEIVRDGTGKRLTSVRSVRAAKAAAPFRIEDYRGLFADDPIDIEEWSRYIREDTDAMGRLLTDEAGRAPLRIEAPDEPAPAHPLPGGPRP